MCVCLYVDWLIGLWDLQLSLLRTAEQMAILRRNTTRWFPTALREESNRMKSGVAGIELKPRNGRSQHTYYRLHHGHSRLL